MSMSYSGFYAAQTSVEVLAAGEEFGEDTVPDGQVCLTLGGDEIAGFVGTVDEVRAMLQRALTALGPVDDRVLALIERDPDGGTDLSLWVNGREVSPTTIVVDPGAGYTREDWDESTEHDVAVAAEHSPEAAQYVRDAYDGAGDSKYIED